MRLMPITIAVLLNASLRVGQVTCRISSRTSPRKPTGAIPFFKVFSFAMEGIVSSKTSTNKKQQEIVLKNYIDTLRLHTLMLHHDVFSSFVVRFRCHRY